MAKKLRPCLRATLNRPKCSICKFQYTPYEMFSTDKTECVYCVFERGKRADIKQLRMLILTNPALQFKFARFIDVTQESFIGLPTAKESA